MQNVSVGMFLKTSLRIFKCLPAVLIVDCGFFFCCFFFPFLIYNQHLKQTRGGAGLQTFELKLHSYLKMYGLYECMTYISHANK